MLMPNLSCPGLFAESLDRYLLGLIRVSSGGLIINRWGDHWNASMVHCSKKACPVVLPCLWVRALVVVVLGEMGPMRPSHLVVVVEA